MIAVRLLAKMAVVVVGLVGVQAMWVTGDAGAVAPTGLELTAEQPSIDWHHRDEAYLVKLTAGPLGAQVGLELRRPGWPEAAQPSLIGSPVGIDAVTLSGPGSVSSAPGLVPLPARRKNPCQRGAVSNVPRSFWIELPAGAQSLLRIETRLSAPVWLATRYGLDLWTFGEKSTQATRVRAASISTPAGKPTGTRISMTAGALKPGLSPNISGTTNPPLRGGKVAVRFVPLHGSASLSQASWTDPSASPVMQVQTDSRGAFVAKGGGPLAPGRYATLARSMAKGPIVADWNCGPILRIAQNRR